MSKRIRLGFLAAACLFAGWIIGQMATGLAWRQATANTSSGTSANKYDLQSTFIGDTWETWKIDRSNGETWRESDNKLVKIKDASAELPGDYEVVLAANGKVYLTYRLDRKLGRLWNINGTDWMELKPAGA